MNYQENNKDQVILLKRRLFSLPTLLSSVVIIAIIYFLANRFDLNWQEVLESVGAINPWTYLLAILVYYASFAFRGIRWKIIARGAGIHDLSHARLPSALKFSQLIVAGWFVNSVTWLRLGDVYRAFTFSEESGSDFSWSLGTVLAERVVDMVTVLVLIGIGAVLFSTTRESDGVGYIVSATFIMTIALVALLAVMGKCGVRAAHFLPSRFEIAYLSFHKGTLKGLKQRQLSIVFGMGLVGWLLEVGRLYFVIQALDFTIGTPLILLVTMGHAVLSAVPTPGGFGAVEPGMIALLMLGMVREDAVSVVLVDRSITYLSVIAVGGIVFMIWQFSNVRKQRRGSRVVTDVGDEGT